ncbi:MAG TPA: NTP transferase domain-containing protein [Brevibacterium sp.]|nr:NTP transferase domain-containing protein [Brevibacterium sp.]
MRALDPSRRTRVVIQSRLNSSRLPGKAMLDLAGTPLILLVSRRAARTGHEVVVATSEEDYDEIIAAAVESAGIPVVRGSLDDVLDRFVTACADLDDDDLVVRLTGDNPLVDSTLIDELIAATAAAGHRYGRVDIESAPEGFGAEVFTAADLRQAAATADEAYDREHVTPWLRRALGEHLHIPTGAPSDIHAYRATVDTLNDYVRVSRLFRGVSDPVGADWRELIRELRTAGALGELRAPRKDRSLSGPSALALDAALLSVHEGTTAERARQSSVIRELLVAAVDAGVTDIALDTDSPAVVAAMQRAGFPALSERLTFLIRTPSDPGAGADRVRGDIERTFALLGRRRARALIMPSAEQAPDVWPVLRRFVADGVVARSGCRAATPDELMAALDLPDVGLLELDLRAANWASEVAPVLESAASRGVHVMALVRPTATGSLHGLISQSWCAGLIVAAGTVEALGEIMVAAQTP